MENSIKEIDKVFKEKLINYEEDPSPELWRRLNFRLSRSRIISSILFLTVILAVLIFWLVIPKLDAKIVVDQKITNTISNFNTNSNEQKTSNILSKIDNPNILNKKSSLQTIKSLILETTQTVNIITENAQDLNNPKMSIFGNYSKIELLKPLSILQITDNLSDDCILNKKSKSEYASSFNDVIERKALSISLELGRNTSWKTLSAESQYQDFADYRNANEESTINTVFGIKFNYHFKNWVFSSGLTYSSIGEKISYNINETIIDPDGGRYLIDTLWATIYTPESGWTDMIVGYDKTYEEAYKDVNFDICNTNTYSYLEIPLLIGYKIDIRNFSICPTVGISMGLLHSANIKLPSIDSNGIPSFSENSQYLKAVVSNMVFDMNFEYRVNENYGLFVKPFYKIGLNSIYQNYPLKGKYNNAGIKIGFSIYL